MGLDYLQEILIDADAVLTTAINIKFGMSKEVIFNEESCSGEDRDSVQWMPNSPDSGEVVVYKTIWDSTPYSEQKFRLCSKLAREGSSILRTAKYG